MLSFHIYYQKHNKKKILWYFCLAIKACQFIHWIQSVTVLQSGNLVRLAVKRIFRFHLSKVLILFGKMVGIYTDRPMPPYRTRWGYQLQVLLNFYYCSITIRFFEQKDCYRYRFHLFNGKYRLSICFDGKYCLDTFLYKPWCKFFSLFISDWFVPFIISVEIIHLSHAFGYILT